MRRQRLLRNRLIVEPRSVRSKISHGGGPSEPFASAHRGTTAHVSGYYGDTRSTEMSDARPVQMPAGDLYYSCFGALDPGAKPGPNVEHRMADFYGSGLRNHCPISSQYLLSGWATWKRHGQRFKSADGRADLSIYSLPNEAGETPATYLRHNLRMDRSALQYTRIARSFFAISSEREGVILYSRCNFSKRGRGAIHCFDLVYPQEEKRSWDAVVTRISLSLRPLEG